MKRIQQREDTSIDHSIDLWSLETHHEKEKRPLHHSKLWPTVTEKIKKPNQEAAKIRGCLRGWPKDRREEKKRSMLQFSDVSREISRETNPTPTKAKTSERREDEVVGTNHRQPRQSSRRASLPSSNTYPNDNLTWTNPQRTYKWRQISKQNIGRNRTNTLTTLKPKKSEIGSPSRSKTENGKSWRTNNLNGGLKPPRRLDEVEAPIEKLLPRKPALRRARKPI